jgi:uncharacterized protein (TIGR02996 family)
MNQADSLLHAILDQPEEEAPWLVLADWLEEQGDPDNLARAELARLQAARRRAGGPSERSLLPHVRAWQSAHGRRLLGALFGLLGKRLSLFEAGWATLAYLVADVASPGQDMVQPGSRWHGELNQPPYAFPTVLTISTRRGNVFTGEMSQDFSALYGTAVSGRFYFEGAVLAGRVVAFITNRVERAGIFPGLYIANLSRKNRALAGTWRVPRYDLEGTFALERRKPGRRTDED